MNIILERVFNVCKTVRETSPKHTNFKKLITRTRKTFKAHDFDLIIKTKKDKNLDPDKWYIMAYYDAEDDANSDTPIEVIVYHNLEGIEDFGPHQITAFLTEIYDAVVHEFRHRYQSIRRDHKEFVAPVHTPYEDYLSNQDELDAYAFSITIELLRTMEPYRIRRYLGRISIMSKMRTGPNYTSPTLRAYIGHFGLTELTRRLAKKIYKHLETVDRRFIFM